MSILSVNLAFIVKTLLGWLEYSNSNFIGRREIHKTITVCEKGKSIENFLFEIGFK